MKYEVWLNRIELYGVQIVRESAERQITTYDAVGAGKFPLAENRGLKSWDIQCELTEHNDMRLPNWSKASEIFDDLDDLLRKKEPSRLVIYSDYVKASERVLLKGYSREETVSGVYAVKLSCTEYVAAVVRTTDMPYTPRPGKAPGLPEKVVIGYKGPQSGMHPYELYLLAQQNDVDAQWMCNGAIVTNPAMLEEGDIVTPVLSREGGRGWFTDADKLEPVDPSKAGREIYGGLKKLDQALYDAMIGTFLRMADKVYPEKDKEWKYR